MNISLGKEVHKKTEHKPVAIGDRKTKKEWLNKVRLTCPLCHCKRGGASQKS